MVERDNKVVIIGAGIGGLAAALRLSHAGCDVTVLEAHSTPGGKIRTIPSAAGPVDAGPTVLTLRAVFEDLFEDVGLSLDDHVTLTQLHTLARHYWDDGTTLDLTIDPEINFANVRAAFGEKSAREFIRFSARTARLFDAFDGPMMQTNAPSQLDLTRRVLRQPRLIGDMAPHRTLAGLLEVSFSDPRLRQLFGRYATYVGGSPYTSPALLSLIWQAEAKGVWTVKGGMRALAQAVATCAETFGATFRYNTPALAIHQANGQTTGVETAEGTVEADTVLFNGDPRALSTGALGPDFGGVIPKAATEPRSLSAFVGAFAAAPSGPSLAHHTVFFGTDLKAEFTDLARGRVPTDATLYLCAQDHAKACENELQRFEVILNAPAGLNMSKEEKAQCQTLIFERFKAFGLHFTPTPDPGAMTTPTEFGTLFPASQGALYGRSPQGLMAAFKRPTARTNIKGLYLCGGGAHPGAGVPMATLSARHAAEAILSDLTSTSKSRRTATPGGTLTGSAPVGPKQSLS